MCVRILRRDVDQIGYSRNFTIIDTSEQNTLMKRVLKRVKYWSKKYDPRSILGAISNAKNELLTPADYENQQGSLFEQIVGRCYALYQKELRNNQCMDFDDLIMNTIRLFKENEDALQFYQRKFHYIHVDEYQDTNHAQYTLVNLLADRFKNLCVVGDADQSIYGWRGANMQNILDFEKIIRMQQWFCWNKITAQLRRFWMLRIKSSKTTATVQTKICGLKIEPVKNHLLSRG